MIEKAAHRLVLVRLTLDMLRLVHTTYAPNEEPFGARMETLAVALCVALGTFEGKPFTATKIAAYLDMPRNSVVRRLKRLERKWDAIERGPRSTYVMRAEIANSSTALMAHQSIRRLLDDAMSQLHVLDKSAA